MMMMIIAINSVTNPEMMSLSNNDILTDCIAAS